MSREKLDTLEDVMSDLYRLGEKWCALQKDGHPARYKLTRFKGVYCASWGLIEGGLAGYGSCIADAHARLVDKLHEAVSRHLRDSNLESDLEASLEAVEKKALFLVKK